MLPRPASCFPPVGEEACPRRTGYQQFTTPHLQHLTTPCAHLHFANNLCRQSRLVTWPWVLCHHLSDFYDGHSLPSVHSEATSLKKASVIPTVRLHLPLPGPTRALFLSLPRGPKDQLYIISAQILLILQTASAFCTAACLISI